MPKRLLSIALIVLILTNVFGLTTLIGPVHGSRSMSDVGFVSMTTCMNVSVLENGRASVSILMNISSPSLAGLYRRTLAAPTNTSVGEEVPIPEKTTEKIQSGGNTSDILLPVKEEFYRSVMKEQLLSFGLLL